MRLLVATRQWVEKTVKGQDSTEGAKTAGTCNYAESNSLLGLDKRLSTIIGALE